MKAPETISRSQRVVAHWHRESDTYKKDGFPLLAAEVLKNCELIEGWMSMSVRRFVWYKFRNLMGAS